MAKQDGRKLDHQSLEALRLTAVRRVLEEGRTPSEVIRSLGLCRTSIYPWLRKHRAKGEAALRMRKAAGPAPKLTVKQRAQVHRWIVGQDPRQHGFSAGLWTRARVACLIEKRLGVKMKLTAVGRLLASLDITSQKPLRRASGRNSEAVEQWMKQDYPRLRRRARQQGATLFYLDEPGGGRESNLEKTYGLRERTTRMRTRGDGRIGNPIRAMTPRGEFWSGLGIGAPSAARLVKFLKAFRRGSRGRVFLLVDARPHYRVKPMAAYVASCSGELELHFLPC